MDGFHRDSLDDGLLPDGFEHEFEAFARALDPGSDGRRCVRLTSSHVPPRDVSLEQIFTGLGPISSS